MTIEHTKTPWTYLPASRPNGPERSLDCAILDTQREIIAETLQIVGEWKRRPAAANAQLIVQAVNSFEAMKAVIVEGMARLEATGISAHETYSHKRDKAAQAYYIRLQRALALAEGKEGEA